jgi:hypothetical protein
MELILQATNEIQERAAIPSSYKLGPFFHLPQDIDVVQRWGQVVPAIEFDGARGGKEKVSGKNMI